MLLWFWADISCRFSVAGLPGAMELAVVGAGEAMPSGFWGYLDSRNLAICYSNSERELRIGSI